MEGVRSTPGVRGGAYPAYSVDSLEFQWRTLVPFVLELYLSSTGVPLENLGSTGVPLENLGSTGAPGNAPGHGQVVPQPKACRGH